MFKAPKEIANNKMVLECLDAKEEGFIDYKYDVFLKDGFVFSGGRMSGGRHGNFNSVSEFRSARAIPKKEYCKIQKEDEA